MTVTAPKDGREMLALLRAGIEHDGGPFCLRYPRDAVPQAVPEMKDIAATKHGTWEVLRQGSEVAILAVGTMVNTSLDAAESLAKKDSTSPS
jgi:1-deoxy-D-xylulose-5-phosphate synthase